MFGTLLTIAAVGGFGYYWAKDKATHAKSVHVTLKLDQGSAKEEDFLKLYHENRSKFYAMRIRIGESFFRYSLHQQNEYSFGIDEENLPLIKEFITSERMTAEEIEKMFGTTLEPDEDA